MFRGRPFPEFLDEGSLERFPVALLLSALCYDRRTGMLDTTDQATHRRIYIIEGHPTFMQSNAEGENVGALLLRRGRITEPDFDRCLRFMQESSRTLQQSLLELRLVSEHDLGTAYKLLAAQLLPLALGMSSGTYRWRETDAFIGRVPEGNFETMAVVFDGIRRQVQKSQVTAFFRGQEDYRLVKTLEFDKLTPYFRRSFSASNVGMQLRGAETYRSLTQTSPQETATQVFALVASGMCILQADEPAVSVEQAAARPEPSDRCQDFEGEEVEKVVPNVLPENPRAVEMIERFHAEILSRDYFTIFGATKETPSDRLRVAYLELAKKWHSDAFAGLSLGETQRKLDEIFSRITEAYETITDKTKREEYLVYLDRKAKGLPTDVQEILRGEQLYDQGAALIRRRDWAGAKAVLEEAVRLNPDPLYFASLGWAIWKRDSKNPQACDEAVKVLMRAVKEQEALPLAYLYLGNIAHARGQLGEASTWWGRCLHFDPHNEEAARGMRMLSQRASEGASREASRPKSGILGRLLKR